MSCLLFFSSLTLRKWSHLNVPLSNQNTIFQKRNLKTNFVPGRVRTFVGQGMRGPNAPFIHTCSTTLLDVFITNLGYKWWNLESSPRFHRLTFLAIKRVCGGIVQAIPILIFRVTSYSPPDIAGLYWLRQTWSTRYLLSLFWSSRLGGGSNALLWQASYSPERL